MIDKYFVKSYIYKVPRYKEDNRRKGVCVMRISSISVAQPRNVNYNLKSRCSQNPNFQGKGGLFGLVGGTAVGLGLTFISGGALAWTIPLFGGAAGIGGDMYEKKDKPSTDQYGRPLY